MKEPIWKVNRERLKETRNTVEVGVRHKSFSSEDKRIRGMLVKWMQKRGLSPRIDDFGHIYGRRNGLHNELPSVTVGFHLDESRIGGNYGGILGAVTALEAIDTLNQYGIVTERPIDLVNVKNSESSRFKVPMYGNREVYCYMELHVGQDPVLDANKTSIGVVEGILGITSLQVQLMRETAYAGTAPRSYRNVTTSKIRIAIQEMICEIDPEITAVIGELSMSPNIPYCIPDELHFSIDICHEDDSIRKLASEFIQQKIVTLATAEQFEIKISTLRDDGPTRFSEEMIDLIQQGADVFQYSAARIAGEMKCDSGDSKHFAKTGMILVPSAGHDDMEKGLNVLLYVILALANRIDDRI